MERRLHAFACLNKFKASVKNEKGKRIVSEI